MKQDMMFSDYPERDEDATVAASNLQKWHTFLWMGLGAVLTYAILGSSLPDNLFDSFSSVFLWLMLLLAPATGGIVILKFPFWQTLPLRRRKAAVLYSFGLSLLTLSTTILFGIQLHRYEPEFWLTITAVTLVYGGFILWLYFHLSRQALVEEGNLFP